MQVDFYRVPSEEALTTQVSAHIAYQRYNQVVFRGFLPTAAQNVPAVSVILNSNVGQDLARVIDSRQQQAAAEQNRADLDPQSGTLLEYPCNPAVLPLPATYVPSGKLELGPIFSPWTAEQAAEGVLNYWSGARRFCAVAHPSTRLQINASTASNPELNQLYFAGELHHNISADLYSLYTGPREWSRQYRNLQTLKAFSLSKANDQLNAALVTSLRATAIVEPDSRVAVVDVSSTHWQDARLASVRKVTAALGIGVAEKRLGGDGVPLAINGTVDQMMDNIARRGTRALLEPPDRRMKAQQTSHLAGHILAMLHDDQVPEGGNFRKVLNVRIAECNQDPRLAGDVVMAYRTARTVIANGGDRGFARAGLQNQLESLVG